MLRKITLNGREVPVPVPIATLSQLVSWVETTLAQSGQVITCLMLNGKPIDDLNLLHVKGDIKLADDACIDLRLESPKDLIIQSLETIYDLSKVVQVNIKHVAVACWKLGNEKSVPDQLSTLLGDLKLILSLMHQVIGLAELFPTDMTAIEGIQALVNSQIEGISQKISFRNWREIAKILLHRTEVSIKDLSVEIELLHIQALSQQHSNSKTIAATSSKSI